jgi:4-hydroxy-tetrahydrodipicolinate synthase
MARKRKFQGTGVALVTPFKKDGSLDEAALRRLVDFQIKGGVEAIVPVGTTGESPSLTLEEHRRVFEIVKQQAMGRVKIFGGTGSNSTQKAIEQTLIAKEIGLDAALVVGPYYNKPTQEGYFQHYQAIALATDFPIIVYNVPGRTGGNIEAATSLRMAREIPQVIAVKEASGNLGQIMDIARSKPDDFALLSGDDAFTFPLMALGGDGCISVVGNQVPKQFSDMVRFCLTGKWNKALALHNELLPLMNVNFIESNPIPVKASLAMMGLIEEVYRLPLVRISQSNRDKLTALLKERKLI